MTAGPAIPIQRAEPAMPATAECAVLAPVHIATIARRQGETGIQTHSRTLHDGLAAAGFNCGLHTPFDAGLKWRPVFALRPLALNHVNKTWATRWHRHWHQVALRQHLVRSLRHEPRAVIIAQCPVSARAALEARSILNARFQVALVCHFNFSEATEYRDKGELAGPIAFERMLQLEREVLQGVDQVIYVSHWARRVVEKERGLQPQSSAVIWNGIARGVPKSNLTRGALGLAADDLVLANVGTLEPRKNQLALLDLFAHLIPDHPSARLMLIGDGPDRKAIEGRIAQLGLGPRVRMLGFRRDVPDVLGLSDVYLHAALLENCPISLLEAARAGLPIAAAPTGGVAELLEVLGGIPLIPNDPAGSARLLHPLLADRAARAQAGRHTRDAFGRHFTREAMLTAYVRALKLGPDSAEGRS